MTDKQAAGLRGVRRCDRCNGIMIHSRLRGYYCTNGCAPLGIEEVARKEGREPQSLKAAFDPRSYVDSLGSLTNDQRMAIIWEYEKRYCGLCGEPNDPSGGGCENCRCACGLTP